MSHLDDVSLILLKPQLPMMVNGTSVSKAGKQVIFFYFNNNKTIFDIFMYFFQQIFRYLNFLCILIIIFFF